MMPFSIVAQSCYYMEGRVCLWKRSFVSLSSIDYNSVRMSVCRQSEALMKLTIV